MLRIYVYLFIAPFIAGLFLRWGFRKAQRACLVPLLTLVLAAVCWIVERTVPSYGWELYGCVALQATCLFLGTLIMGIVCRVRAQK